MKHFLIFICLIYLVSSCEIAKDAISSGTIYDHLRVDTVSIENPVYPDSIELRIKQVENSLLTAFNDSTVTADNLRDRMKHHHIPSVSIAVVNDYSLEWARAYGWADRDLQIPATVNTLYQAASVSKSVHALGFLQWAEKNNIDLYDDVNNHIKNWELNYNKKANGKKVSLANILSHTAGLTPSGFNGYKEGINLPSTLQILNGKVNCNSSRVRLTSEPGLEFQYSGGGTTITQYILEENINTSYDVHMKNEILNPLGMINSFYTQPPPENKALSTGHWTKGTPVKGKFHRYPEMAAAGLWTNPTELSQFIIELQKSLEGKSNRFLSKEMTERMMSSHLNNGFTGLGVFLQPLNNVDYFTHNGSNAGFKCAYFGSLEKGKGLIIMTNSDNYDIIPEIINSIVTVYE